MKRGQKINKKAQLTLFIIIILILVGVVIIFLVIRGIEKEPVADIKDVFVGPVNDAIDNCVESTLIDGVRLIGLQGGYFNLPEKHFKTDLETIDYAYYNKKADLVSISEMENEISSYIELALPFCINDSAFPDLELEKREVDAKTNIAEDYVSVNVNFPISITNQEKTVVLEETYEKEVSAQIPDVYKVANDIINNIIANPEFIDMTYLSELDYEIVILPYDAENFIYSINDQSHRLDNIPYVFRFAVEK